MTQRPKKSTAIGIDIGGGTIRAGVVDAAGTLAVREITPLPARGAPRGLSAAIKKLLAQVQAQHKVELPAAVGVGLPGIWDRKTGVMRKAVNLPALVGVNLQELFADCFGSPAYLDSDVNCAAWAQYRAAQKNAASARVVYLSLGTGVGGAAIVDDALLRHTNGGGGHFGFLCVEPDERHGVVVGHAPALLSDFAGGPALAHHTARELNVPPGKPVDDLGPRTCAAAARALAITIRNLIAIYQPNLCLLGGGVIDHYPKLVAATEAEYRRHPHPLALPDFLIAAGALASHDAGVIGAALLALKPPHGSESEPA